MPAHKSEAHVGRLKFSNGDLLTKKDVKAHDIADGLAKQAVAEHRVPKWRLSSGKRMRMMLSIC